MTYDPIDRTADWPQDASEITKEDYDNGYFDENDADDWTAAYDEDDDPRERLWQAVYRLEAEVEYIKREHDAAEYKQTVLTLKSKLADLYEQLTTRVEQPIE